MKIIYNGHTIEGTPAEVMELLKPQKAEQPKRKYHTKVTRKHWTPKELYILFNNLDRSNQQLAKLLDNRSVLAIGTVRYKLRTGTEMNDNLRAAAREAIESLGSDVKVDVESRIKV